MLPRTSPSWPTLGQVQKLTELFEEKALPPAEPQVVQKPEPVPKLKPELLLRIQFALGELQAEAPSSPKPEFKIAQALKTPLHETQPDDGAIGDEEVASRNRSWLAADNYRRFLH